MNKNFLNYLLVLTAVISLLFSCNPVSIYNKIIEKEEKVNEAWAQVQNVYQRRADLIPNLVNTVKAYMKYEKETLESVIKLRNQATQITVTKEVLEDPVLFKKFQDAQGELSGALSKLIAVTENYPQLKASEQFTTLMAQLEGTENRIAVERRRYNEAVRGYNTFIRQFPNNLVAGDKFKTKEMFQADKGADKTPEVNFDN